MACRCGGYARRATFYARRRANTRFRSAVRRVMACRCGGHARQATRFACQRANGRFQSAVRTGMAFHCGGHAQQATRCACRRANSRWYRAYGHGVSLRRVRQAGDLFRASARHERRTVHTIHGIALPHAAAHLSIPEYRSPPTRATGHPHSARAYPRVPPNTPCSRPRWRGRELGATWAANCGVLSPSLRVLKPTYN
jgi:hypothetical protein